MKPRGWQVKELDKFNKHSDKAYLMEATPGAGKTIFSGFCAKSLADDGIIDFTVCVVPTTALKGDDEAGFLGDFNKVGVQVTTVLKDGKDMPKEFAGGVVTYAQLPNIVETFKIWARKGVRLFFIFDEIHHASDNKWGIATEQCGEIATRILAMTGTLFRGDKKKIAFVQYGKDDLAIPDGKYKYRTAVSQSVCRPVLFLSDTGTAEYIYGEAEEKVEISEANDDQIGKVQSVIFSKDAEWLDTVLAKADETLEEYRYSAPNAGGIVICRPGVDENDDRHLFEIAKAVEKLTGDSPTVITHDDPDANSKIERFRKSRDKWIVSVRKISEGVDIKRLRVMVMATYPSTELLFRQLVGRVVRVVDPQANEDATIYMAKFKKLVEFASRIQDEAEAGLSDKRDASEQGERSDGAVDFVPIGSTHEDGGGISSMGDQYAACEIEFAERLKRDDRQLSNVPITSIAYLMRKTGVEIPETTSHQEPLALRKKRKRGELNTLVRKTAILLGDKKGGKPEFSYIWRTLNKNLGVKNIDDLIDNHPIEKIDSAIDIVKSLFHGVCNVA